MRIFLLNKELRSKFARLFGVKNKRGPFIIPRSQHNITRKNISPSALKVLYRLKDLNYVSYLVGGSVRDLLLNCRPKDFDIATDGRPEEVQKLFANSCIIGRRFRLLHVFFDQEIIEVSTFRAKAQASAQCSSTGSNIPMMIAADNTYGTMEEDAWRRDFTINALYYNIADFSIVDFTGGIKDLNYRVIRMIGNPVARYYEDPLRLLRAIRLAAKLKFTIDPQTEAPLKTLSGLLQEIPQSRLFNELLKLFFKGSAQSSFHYLKQYDYIDVLFPNLSLILKIEDNKKQCKLIQLSLCATDQRFLEGRSLNPGFLLSVLLWPRVSYELDRSQKTFRHFYQALHHAIDKVITDQNNVLRIPRRFIVTMRSVWVMQYQLLRRRGKRVYSVLQHRYFRATFDFLMLRTEAGEPFQEIVHWWQAFQKVSYVKQREMVLELNKRKRR